MANGEDAILDLLGKYFPNAHPSFIMGRGDDCALITVPLVSSVVANPSLDKDSESKDLRDSDSENKSSERKDSGNKASEKTALLAVTSDIFTENAHFRSRYFSPAQIGHKALAVNISDLAGNGARPSAFSLNLTLTDDQDFAWLEEFFASMAKLSQRFGMGLSGGDLAKSPRPKRWQPVPLNRSVNGVSETHGLSPHLERTSSDVSGNTSEENSLNLDEENGLNIGITAWGDYGHGGLPLLRHKSYTPKKSSAIEDGYVLFVVGEIGLARVGLFALESSKNRDEMQEALRLYPVSCEAHLSPMPLVEEGLFLSQFAHLFPVFLMDISDGLMRDIPRLLARQGIIEENKKALGARIILLEENLNLETISYAKSLGEDAALFAYSGGEDYGLLGACSKDAWIELQKKWKGQSAFARIWKIGDVCQENLTLNDACIKENGFDHFHQ